MLTKWIGYIRLSELVNMDDYLTNRYRNLNIFGGSCKWRNSPRSVRKPCDKPLA